MGFVARVTLVPDAAVDLRVTSTSGLTPLGKALRFFASGEAAGGEAARAWRRSVGGQLVGAQLTGRVNEAAGSVAFRCAIISRGEGRRAVASAGRTRGVQRAFGRRLACRADDEAGRRQPGA